MSHSFLESSFIEFVFLARLNTDQLPFLAVRASCELGLGGLSPNP